ncbi:MAG: GNAT family N-acetyltransferase [Candidatus Odinarchaeota archaeon]
MDNPFRLKRIQLDSAAKVLVRAFENDPLFIAYFPDPKLRVEQNYHLMKYCLRDYMRYGKVYTTSPKLEGISLWIFKDPVEVQKNKLRNLFDNWHSFRLAVNLGVALEKVYSIYEHIITTQYELVPTPHWYLVMIGIDPDFQGEGYASRLIKPILTRIDKDQLECYLDTNNKNNVEIYQHFGFRVLKEYQIPRTNVINWSMLRNPQ